MARDRANQGHVAVVFGSTGTAGMGVVHACLADPGVSGGAGNHASPIIDFAPQAPPSPLLGVNRWLLAPLLRVIPALGISAVDLGRAMLRVGLDESWHGSRTLENSDLKSLLREGNHFGG